MREKKRSTTLKNQKFNFVLGTGGGLGSNLVRAAHAAFDSGDVKAARIELEKAHVEMEKIKMEADLQMQLAETKQRMAREDRESTERIRLQEQAAHQAEHESNMKEIDDAHKKNEETLRGLHEQQMNEQDAALQEFNERATKFELEAAQHENTGLLLKRQLEEKEKLIAQKAAAIQKDLVSLGADDKSDTQYVSKAWLEYIEGRIWHENICPPDEMRAFRQAKADQLRMRAQQQEEIRVQNRAQALSEMPQEEKLRYAMLASTELRPGPQPPVIRHTRSAPPVDHVDN